MRGTWPPLVDHSDLSVIGIIHCGIGNLSSVANAIDHLGGDPLIVSDPAQLEECEKIILPGVGSFAHAMEALLGAGFGPALQDHVIGQKKPTLGICLGMQLMASRGMEGGGCDGLGWFAGSVEKVLVEKSSARIPHVGWNQIKSQRPHALMQGVPPAADFYFVHSYTMRPSDPGALIATCDYGDGVTAIVGRDNIFATQFHPEKSQDHGLRILGNFLDWSPRQD